MWSSSMCDTQTTSSFRPASRNRPRKSRVFFSYEVWRPPSTSRRRGGWSPEARRRQSPSAAWKAVIFTAGRGGVEIHGLERLGGLGEAGVGLDSPEPGGVLPAVVRSGQRLRGPAHDADDLRRREARLAGEHLGGDAGDEWARHARSRHRDPAAVRRRESARGHDVTAGRGDLRFVAPVPGWPLARRAVDPLGRLLAVADRDDPMATGQRADRRAIDVACGT